MQASRVTSSHVLITPWELCFAAREIFPAAEFNEVTSEEGATEIELSLSSSISPVRISTGVMKKKFVEEIDLLRVLIEADRVCSSRNVERRRLNTATFCIQESLRDWTGFRRKMYEASGKKCVDLIIDFLRSPDARHSSSASSSSSSSSCSSSPSSSSLVGADSSMDDEQLRQCGLHPDQIDVESTDADLAYFRNVVEKCQSLNYEDKLKIMDSFRAIYPCIYQRIKSGCVRPLGPIVPKPKVLSEHDRRFQEILQELSRSISGQTTVVKSLASYLAGQEGESLLRSTSSSSQQGIFRNKWVFFFVGPTGTGKTALAKAAGERMRKRVGNNEDRVVTFNMERFSSAGAGSLFFGVEGPDYQGAFIKPGLAEMLDTFATPAGSDGDIQIYEVRDIVILLDEFEKTDPVLKQSMLTFFEKGVANMHYLIKSSEVGSSQAKKVSLRYIFKECVLIATSNLFSSEILQAFNNGKTKSIIVTDFKKLNGVHSSKITCSPELLERMKISPFGPIPRKELYQGLIKKQMELFFSAVKEKYQYRECLVENEVLTLQVLEDILYGDGIGIRKIKEYFSSIFSQLDEHERWDVAKEKIVFLIHKGKFSFCTHDFDDVLCEYNLRENSLTVVEG